MADPAPVTKSIDSHGRIDIPDSFWTAIGLAHGKSCKVTFVRNAAGQPTIVLTNPNYLPPPPVLSKITGLTAMVSPMSPEINLSWNKPAEVAILNRYDILRDGVKIVSMLPSIASYNDKLVEYGKTYSYQVRSADNFNNLGPLSDPCPATVYPIPPAPTIYDNFDGVIFDFSKNGNRSPNGKWLLEYGIQVVGDDDQGYAKIQDGMLTARPKQEDNVTHSVLVRSTQQWAAAKYSFDIITGLRNWTTPKTWHAAWFFFRHIDKRRHYYGVLKPNGFEFGRKDAPAMIDGRPITQAEIETYQRYLYENKNFTLKPGFKHHIDLEVIGVNPTIKVWLDGVFVGTFTDDGKLSDGKGLIPAPTFSCGEWCAYTEDAEAYWDNVTVEPRQQT